MDASDRGEVAVSADPNDISQDIDEKMSSIIDSPSLYPYILRGINRRYNLSGSDGLGERKHNHIKITIRNLLRQFTQGDCEEEEIEEGEDCEGCEEGEEVGGGDGDGESSGLKDQGGTELNCERGEDCEEGEAEEGEEGEDDDSVIEFEEQGITEEKFLNGCNFSMEVQVTWNELQKNLNSKNKFMPMPIPFGQTELKITYEEVEYYLGVFTKILSQYEIVRKTLPRERRQLYEPYMRFQIFIFIRKTRKPRKINDFFAMEQKNQEVKVLVDARVLALAQNLLKVKEYSSLLQFLLEGEKPSEDLLLFWLVSYHRDLFTYIQMIDEYIRPHMNK